MSSSKWYKELIHDLGILHFCDSDIQRQLIDRKKNNTTTIFSHLDNSLVVLSVGFTKWNPAYTKKKGKIFNLLTEKA